jgi:TRAP-type C4-dicarboxylate transport system permease small subunit
MSLNDLKGLKYYIFYCVIVLGFFIYSGITGWKWFNPTRTESERPTGRTGHIYRYHK